MDYATSIGLTAALVQVIKSAIPLESRYVPVLSLLVGMAVGYAVGIREVVELLTIGLGASGFYDVAGKPTRDVIKKII